MDSQSQKDLFVYWATQYIKRKCIGAKIKEESNSSGIGLCWEYLGKIRTAAWSFAQIKEAEAGGPDAQRSLIKSEVQPQVPELWPD